jgi:hypothetical protein
MWRKSGFRPSKLRRPEKLLHARSAKLPFDAVPLQPRCRSKCRTSGRSERRYLRGGHDAARSRSARSRGGGSSQRARSLAYSAGPRATPAHFSNERDDAWHLLDRPADAAQSFCRLRPQSLLDSHRFLLRRGAGTVLHLAACGIYPLSRRTFGLLVQHPPARSGEYFPAGPSEES